MQELLSHKRKNANSTEYIYTKKFQKSTDLNISCNTQVYLVSKSLSNEIFFIARLTSTISNEKTEMYYDLGNFILCIAEGLIHETGE